jgi:hypothetical protein
MYLSVGRGVVHFQGLAALVLSLSALAAAAACVSLLAVPRRRVRCGLTWACLGLLVLAALLKAVEERAPASVSMLNGFAAEPVLRQWLDQPRIAAWGSEGAPAATVWLKISCITLLALAILFRWAGVTKESFQNVPMLTLATVICFGSPFLAWFTLEGLPYLFETLPSIQPARAFMADTSFALSMFAVVLWLWWLAGTVVCLLALRACGIRTGWTNTTPQGAVGLDRT